jgi:hypothetical protein
MMTFLAAAFKWVGGSKLLPAGILMSLLTLGHQVILQRDGRMKAEAAAGAKQVCEAEHTLAAVKAELGAAKRVAAKAVEAVEFERQVTEELRGERRAIKEEYDAYKVAASTDPRCLSDGVLDLLRGDAKGSVRPKLDKR